MDEKALYAKHYDEYMMEQARTGRLREGIAAHLDEWMHSDVAGMVKYWHLQADRHAKHHAKREASRMIDGAIEKENRS